MQMIMRSRLAAFPLGTKTLQSVGCEHMSVSSNPIRVRVQAAGYLIGRGFDEVLPFLYSVAGQEIESAYRAAIIVKHHDRLKGLQLLDAILATADHPAAPVTVLDIFSKVDFKGVKLESDDVQLAEARRLLAEEIATLTD